MEIIKHLPAFLRCFTSSNNLNTYLLEGSNRIFINLKHTKLIKHAENDLSTLNIKVGR